MKFLIARWFINPGAEDKVWPVLQALPGKVLEAEPDTLMYIVHKPDADASLPPLPGTEVIFFEGYKNEDAFAAHLGGEVFSQFVKDYGGCFRRPFPSPGCDQPGNFVAVENLIRLDGFVRSEAAGLLAPPV